MENRMKELGRTGTRFHRCRYLDKQVFCLQFGGTPTFYLNSELCWPQFQPELQKAQGLSLAPLQYRNSLGNWLWLSLDGRCSKEISLEQDPLHLCIFGVVCLPFSFFLKGQIRRKLWVDMLVYLMKSWKRSCPIPLFELGVELWRGNPPAVPSSESGLCVLGAAAMERQPSSQTLDGLTEQQASSVTGWLQ